MVRRAVEVRPGGGVLRIRLPCRLQDRHHAAGGWLRREVHEGWPLGLEGDWRRNQTHRGGTAGDCSVGTPPHRATSPSRVLRRYPVQKDIPSQVLLLSNGKGVNTRGL